MVNARWQLSSSDGEVALILRCSVEVEVEVNERKERAATTRMFCCACDDLSDCWSYYWPKIRCASACSWAFVGDTGEKVDALDLGGPKRRRSGEMRVCMDAGLRRKRTTNDNNDNRRKV